MKNHIVFNKRLNFEIVNHSHILISNKSQYYVVNGISAQIVRLIILMGKIEIPEVVHYGELNFKNHRQLEKKIHQLIASLVQLKIVSLK